METKLIFEQSVPGRQGIYFQKCDVPQKKVSDLIPNKYLRKEPAPFPEIGEFGIIRHFTRLSHRNFSIDKNFYPLGSCTMKYNPRINETVAGMDGFCNIHPMQDPATAQGALEILYQLTEMLKQVSGLPYVSLQPAAGAHGELTSLMMIKAYFEKKGEDRPIILIPDSAHGTNPASCTIAGFQVKNIHTDKRTGCTDLEHLKSQLTPQVAALMMTNPNTLGLFDVNIIEIAKLMHQQGSLVYMDGANMNAIQGQALPGEFGIDIMHFNLHKTFSTPHGGGGPGAGPVAFNEKLAPFRPIPEVLRNNQGEYYLNDKLPDSIGKVKAYFGNFSVLVRAYCYIRALGKQGILDNSTYAVLNANYVFQKLKNYFKVPYDKPCMHEFVVSCDPQAEKGVRALDIAKRLLDFGIHAPTIYFPLIVHECFMIEPTETETKETLDEFISVMIQILREVDENPEKVKTAPHELPVSRLDEKQAAINCCLTYTETKS